ncbi:unnamed protein product [Adineta steineri]|uniref:Uncharacterized protein n=1 Tax=Adineta steineri TaxID=433720 RepID=A0A819TZE2_9BILA|nr:unnamed protein product [Adineta steineri]CAF4083234.1 unnamed protein product [Adineta steineri]
MKITLMLEHTDTITDEDEYIIVDDQVIDEIKQSVKRKLSKRIKYCEKNKKLSTTHDEHNNNFVMLVDDQVPTHTNEHQKIIYKLVMTVVLQTIAIVV